ncbi:MAG: hypothetical protein C5B47_03690 [Verrucomicrobia bacterium]|nr:MAG: hypothetical protein C5B47_03690 [Verrucomicrobiota bacterium]
MANSFNPSLKIGSSKPVFSQIRTKAFDLLARLGVCKPRIIGPLSFPATNENVKETDAGEGLYGKCERFYSSQYPGKKEYGIQIGRAVIKKTFKRNADIESAARRDPVQRWAKPEYEKSDLLAKLKHRNLVKYVHIDPENRTVTMKDTGFSLMKIRETVRFSFYEDLYIFLEVLNGVKYLHDHDICHNDLHEGNFTLKKDGTVKIVDFGLAEKASPEIKNNNIKFERDRIFLRQILKELLDRHSEIEKSGNSDEKEHYALIKKIAQRDEKFFVYSDLMRLMTELEKMSNFFPRWGKQKLRPQTKFEDVAKLQASFRSPLGLR